MSMRCKKAPLKHSHELLETRGAHRSWPRRSEGGSPGSKNGQCKGPEATGLCTCQESEIEMARENKRKPEGRDVREREVGLTWAALRGLRRAWGPTLICRVRS